MPSIKLAIAGIGNCASSLVQGISFYKDKEPGTAGDKSKYKISDINVVAAFDVNETKTGKDISEAIFASPNCTKKYCNVEETGVIVQKSPLHDGIGKYLEDEIKISKEADCDVVSVLKESKADILINYLPVGSQKAVEFYSQAALEAGVGFVNCIPVFIASDNEWGKKFSDANLPIVGDDIKSQVGATIVHRVLTNLFRDRGVELDKTYQLNVGGNTDFLNMLERERLISKKISKTESVQSQAKRRLSDNNIHIGPSDYVPWLNDNKLCFIRMDGKLFGDVPMNLELRLSVEDSPNSAGVAVDAIRCCKIALDREIGGPLAASSYFMKHPPEQFTDAEARKIVEEFVSK